MRMRRYPALRLSLSAAAFCLVAALAATALVAASANGGQVAPAAAARLGNLVRQDCGSCHGLTLKGGLGKPLTAESVEQWDRDQLAAIILDGVPGTPMPPWRPLLTEVEARWIADMLKQGKLK
jgi:cytochrome c55X